MIWRWLASVLLTVLALVATALFVLLDTERGAVWLAGQAELASGGAVRFDGVSGTLAGGLQVDELRIAAGRTTRIVAEQVTLRMRLAALLRQQLVITALGAERVTVDVAKDEAPDEPFVMPTLRSPVAVELAGFDVGTLTLRIGGEVRTVTGISASGALSGTRLDVVAVRAALAGLELGAAGTAELVPELPVDARVEWRLAEPAVSGAGTVRGTLAALDIEQLVRLPDAVTLSARLTDIVGAPQVEARARWEALRYELPELGPLRAEAGEATITGWLDGWRGGLATAVALEGYPRMQAEGQAHGDLGRIVIDQVRLAGAAGALVARGDFDVSARRLHLDVEASNVDTAAFRPGLEGRLSARASVDALLPDEVEVGVAQLRGTLMRRPLAGSGTIRWREGTLAFRNVALSAGPNRLRADGTVGAELAGRFSLVAPELGVLWPGLAGSLEAQARLGGTRARPLIELDANGSGLVLDGNRMEALDLSLRTDARQQVEASARVRGIVIGANELGDLAATLDGTLKMHRLSAELSGGRVQGALVSAGSWDGTTLRHELGSARIGEAALGEWQLAGSPAIAARAGAFSAGPHCWEQAPTSLCIRTLEWSDAGTRIDAELRDLDLQRFDPWLAPSDFALTGRVQSTIVIEIAGSAISGSVASRLEGGALYYTGGDEPLEAHLDVARLDAKFLPESASVVLELDSARGLHLSVNGVMEAPLGVDAPLYAELTGHLPDIAPLVPVFAGDLDLAEVAGSVTLDAAVGGSLRAPELTGVARLSKGTVALTDLGVKLEGIDVALLGDGTQTLRLQGSARAGGPLTLSGEVTPLAAGGPTARVRVRGNRIDAVRLPDRYVQVSPDVTLRYEAGALATEGSVTIPKADIVIRELPASAVSPSGDAIVVDRQTPEERGEPGQIVQGEIAVVFGRDVRLRAFGLDTLLEGTVKLSQGADREPKGYGVVRLKEGKFGAYGKELTIERGTLGFAGPLDDPAVDLRASRRVDWEGKTVTAGILLGGTASRPESRVFSDPAMSEADALSYLISGRPLQSANQNDRSSIAGAALALGVQQTSPLTQRLGSAVTLDELGMQGGALDETEVVAGKQINPDLYVRFAYGLFSRIGTVLARYRIGRNLSIEAASGEDQSLDLIWSVERD